MRRGRFRNIDDVVRWRLCVGCGACAFACEKKNISLEDVPGDGIRPKGVGLNKRLEVEGLGSEARNAWIFSGVFFLV